MELYFSYLSTYSQKVLLGFYEKGIPFNGHHIDLGDPEVHDKYRELYPFGKVPLLICDDARMIPESSIILEYLDTTFPNSLTLIPAEAEAARRVRFLDRMCDLYLNDPVVSLIFESWKPEPERNMEMMVKASEKIGIMYRLLNDQLLDQPLLGGETFCLADCAAIPSLFYAKSFAPFGDFEALSRYWGEISKRPAYMRLKQEAEPYIEQAMGNSEQVG